MRKSTSSKAKKLIKKKTASKKVTKKVSRSTRPLRATSNKRTSKARSSRSKKTGKAKKTSASQAYSIVRIMGKGQYKLAAADMAKLNRIDNSIVKFVENHHDSDPGTEAQFLKQFNEMVSIVISKGAQLNPRELVSSDIILPFEDTTLEEARGLFRGEGLVPG